MDRFTQYLDVSNGIFNKLFDNRRSDIFHYTSPEVMKIIADKGTLRFSDRFYLNDMSEGYYVLDLVIYNIHSIIEEESPLYELREFIVDECKKYKQIFEKADFKIYQISFSLDQDSLCMWNYYTKGDTIEGYNIHFCSDELCNAIQFDNNQLKPHILCGRVIYDKANQIQYISSFFEQFYNAIYEDKNKNKRLAFSSFKNRIEMIIERLTLVGTFFKNPYFEIEHEYRIALDLRIDEDTIVNLNKQRQYVEKHGLKAPYVDLVFDRTAIKEITLSPTLNVDNIDSELSEILNKHGLQDIDKKISDIPVRY